MHYLTLLPCENKVNFYDLTVNLFPDLLLCYANRLLDFTTPLHQEYLPFLAALNLEDGRFIKSRNNPLLRLKSKFGENVVVDYFI